MPRKKTTTRRKKRATPRRSRSPKVVTKTRYRTRTVTKPRRRRRISKPKTDIMSLVTRAGALGAGAFGGTMVINKASEALGDKIPKGEIIIPGGVALVASYLSMKQKKPGFVSQALDGMAAVGMAQMIGQLTGTIEGIGANLDDVYFELEEGVNGVERQISELEGGMIQDVAEINGIERQISGSYFV